MIAPLSWLKEYVDITLTPKELGEKLTEVGLSVEKITKTSDDIIFELEITPNRPDLLSIIGVAREIAVIEGEKIKLPNLPDLPKPRKTLPIIIKTDSKITKTSDDIIFELEITPNRPDLLSIIGIAREIAAIEGRKIKLANLPDLPKPKKTLPIIIKTDSKINPRFTGIIIGRIKVEQSPKWLKEKLEKIRQRSINNIVDITNYVMLELGNPIHAFDYDKIAGHIMTVHRTKGRERFKSVDGILYHLPKDAVVISDKEKIIDLCGIKGGENSGTYKDTKTVFIRVPVEIPTLIRRTSMSLGLRSIASSIFERGVNTDGTVDSLKRCVDLIKEIAGGEVASELYDIKSKDFRPWKLNLRIERLNKILGIEIPEKKVLEILEILNLSPVVHEKNIIQTTIPAYRNDLKIEEDLIEEVARIYGYNNFPKTMPVGAMPTKQIPYFKDYRLDEKVKNILVADGFSEVYTYSLISEKDLAEEGINTQNLLRVDNPVSREFEYLRPTLKINLLKALTLNKPNFKDINLFELGIVYTGKNLDEAKEEYFLSGITNTKSFFEVKGIIEKISDELGIKLHSAKHIKVLDEGVFFEFNFSEILPHVNLNKKFKPLPKYPPIIEDLAIVAGNNVKTIDIIDEIKSQNSLIVDVSLLDQFEDTRTFHVIYQHEDKNLTGEEVSKIRSKILKTLKEKFNATLKE